MTLVSDIIRDAHRESNLISITENPTTAAQAEGLTLLDRFVASVYGNEAGDPYQPIVIGRGNIDRPQGFPWYQQVPDQTDWFLPANTRMSLNLTSSQDIYLNPTPQDGERFAFIDESDNLSTYNLTINGNGRRIASGLQYVVNTDGANEEYMYRADLGEWVKISPLLAADTFPFPKAFEDYFVTGLAFRINPRYGMTADAQTLSAFQSYERKFKAKYNQRRDISSDPALLLTSGNRYRYYDTSRADATFNSGYARPFLRFG